MAERHQQRGTQDQSSGQSASQGGQSGAPAGTAVPGAQPGIGSGQGPDQPAPEHPGPSQRPSAGTPDIERGSGGQKNAPTPMSPIAWWAIRQGHSRNAPEAAAHSRPHNLAAMRHREGLEHRTVASLTRNDSIPPLTPRNTPGRGASKRLAFRAGPLSSERASFTDSQNTFPRLPGRRRQHRRSPKPHVALA